MAKELGEEASKHGHTYMDAPVSGGTKGAVDGTLTFMVGANSEADFNKAKNVVDNMGKNIFNCQRVGNGQIAKICNNLTLSINMIGASESLALGKSLGMDPKLLTKIMSVSTAGSFVMEKYNPCPGVVETSPASRDYENGFAADLMLKDVKIALAEAKAVKLSTDLGEKAKDIYEELHEKGFGRKDYGVIFQVLDERKR